MVQPHGYRCNRYGDNEYLCCILVSLELLALYTVYNNRMFRSKHTNQPQQQQNPQTAPYSHNYSNTLIQVTQTHMHAACMHAHTLTHTHMQARTHAHTHTCMHAHTHAHKIHIHTWQYKRLGTITMLLGSGWFQPVNFLCDHV